MVITATVRLVDRSRAHTDEYEIDGGITVNRRRDHRFVIIAPGYKYNPTAPSLGPWRLCNSCPVQLQCRMH